MKKLFFILFIFTTVFVSCKKEDDNKEILSGTNAPTATIGKDGDFYLDQTTNILYGPKTSAGWGTGIRLTGQILSGEGTPDASLGIVGDYYLDNTEYLLYGPKTKNGWGAGLQLGAPCEIYLLSDPYKYLTDQYSYGQLKIPFNVFDYSKDKADNSLGLVYVEISNSWHLANGAIGFMDAYFNSRYNFDTSDAALYIYIQPTNGSLWTSQVSLETTTSITRIKIVIIPGEKVNTITSLKDKSPENVINALTK